MKRGLRWAWVIVATVPTLAAVPTLATALATMPAAMAVGDNRQTADAEHSLARSNRRRESADAYGPAPPGPKPAWQADSSPAVEPPRDPAGETSRIHLSAFLNGGGRFSLVQEGDVDLDCDATRVRRIGDDGKLVLTVVEGHRREEASVVAIGGGQPGYRFHLDGLERPFNHAAIAWLNAALAVACGHLNLEELRRAGAALQEEIDALGAEQARLSDELRRRRAELAPLGSQLGALRAEKGAIGGEVAALKAVRATLLTRHRQLLRRGEKLRRDARSGAEAGADLDQLEREVRANDAAEASVRIEVTLLEERLASKEAQQSKRVAELTSAIESLEARLAALQQETSGDLASYLAEIEQRHDALEHQQEEFRHAVAGSEWGQRLVPAVERLQAARGAIR